MIHLWSTRTAESAKPTSGAACTKYNGIPIAGLVYPFATADIRYFHANGSR